MVYDESNGHTIDDVMWFWKKGEGRKLYIFGPYLEILIMSEHTTELYKLSA